MDLTIQVDDVTISSMHVYNYSNGSVSIHVTYNLMSKGSLVATRQEDITEHTRRMEGHILNPNQDARLLHMSVMHALREMLRLRFPELPAPAVAIPPDFTTESTNADPDFTVVEDTHTEKGDGNA